jgi:N-glycosylase/DNA lyase
MKQLISKINKLKKSEVKIVIDQKIKAFKKIKSEKAIFKELCFCLLTANFNAERAIVIQKKIDDGFLTLSEGKLAKILKVLGYRFPNKRAEYIVEARKHDVKQFLKTNPREHIVKNIKGLGMKESSHFLRNIGYLDYAILDFHIIDILEEYKIIERPKTLNRKAYLEIEEKLSILAKKLNLTHGELDFYLWYLETGKVLK